MPVTVFSGKEKALHGGLGDGGGGRTGGGAGDVVGDGGTAVSSDRVLSDRVLFASKNFVLRRISS